jgi:hypothetical protein
MNGSMMEVLKGGGNDHDAVYRGVVPVLPGATIVGV